MGSVSKRAPIGVFDSGVGGLNVLAALRARLPHESFVFLGDTARLPYGIKGSQTIVRYAHQAAQVLVEHEIKMLVIACNTASAAVEELAKRLNPLPVIGVVEPGAAAACAAANHGRIAVIGTESTIAGGAYERAIARRRPDAQVLGRPCPLFVSLTEEGWCEGPIVEAVAERYLGDLRPTSDDPEPLECLVLGCNHFPALRPALEAVVGPRVTLVDSAETMAQAVAEVLTKSERATPAGSKGGVELLATDSPERFARIGARFLDPDLRSDAVSLVHL